MDTLIRVSAGGFPLSNPSTPLDLKMSRMPDTIHEHLKKSQHNSRGFCFPEHPRDHRNCKQKLIPWQHIQAAACAHKSPCSWEKLTEAQARIPKNPTFCTRFCTASLAREAKSCKQENKGINEEKPTGTELRMCVISRISQLGVGRNFKPKKGQLETLSLEGQPWCSGQKSDHPQPLSFVFPNPASGTKLPLLWKQVFQYLFLPIFGMPVLLIPYSLNKQRE